MQNKQNLFMASISHELRTPLTSILGYGELLENTQLDSQQKAYLNRMLHSSKYLLLLVGDFLDIVKLENNEISLDKKETRCHTILMDCVDVIKASLHPDVKLEVDIPFLSHTILADARRIKQVMLNFLSNAAKFTKSGFIKYYVKEIVNIENNKIRVTVNIEDSGIGMSQEVQDALFDPFVTGDSTQGFGLGLHISKEIIKLMDGNIEVSSTEGVGSIFSVTFVVEQGEEKKYLNVLSNKKILVFSDNDQYTNLLSNSLYNFDAEVYYYSPSHDIDLTIKDLLSSQVKYDIVIFDLSSIFCSISDIISTLKVINKNVECLALIEKNITTNLPVFDKVIDLPITTTNLIYTLEEWFVQKHVTNTSIIDFSELKVLVVEDVDMSRKYIEEMFKVNFTLICDSVCNGQEAIDIVKSNYYDIIFMDIRMPVLNGLEATKAIRKFNRDVPIVCMSADVYDEDVQVALNSGMNAFIEKPLDIEEIKKTFVELLNIDVNIQDNIRTTRSSVEDLQINLLKNEAFNNLKENFGTELATELLTSARGSIKEYVDKISLIDRLNKDLQNDFHALKGVLLNLGLTDIAKSADELQKACMSESIDKFKKQRDDFIYAMRGFLEV